MAFGLNPNFSFEIMDGWDFILAEGPNTTINLRKISWNGKPPKVDIRKYGVKDGQEVMGKGISLNDEAAHNLADHLVEEGYGHTHRLMRAIRDRSDYDITWGDRSVEIVDPDKKDTEGFYNADEILMKSFGTGEIYKDDEEE